MIYYTRISSTAFIAGIVFFSACNPRVHTGSPLQRVTIVTSKNIKVISVSGQVPLIPPNKVLSDEDLKTLQLKQLYIKTKQLYKAQRRAQKRLQKHIELKPGKTSKMFLVVRDNKPLDVMLEIDSAQKSVYIKPRHNYGRFLNARYVFRKNDSLHLLDHKRWIYPRINIITISNNSIDVSRFEPVKKGTFKISVSSGIETFNLRKDTGQYHSWGIFGIELGTDYFYRENKFLSFNLGAAAVSPLNLDEGHDYTDYRETGTSVYASIRDNFEKGKFDVGYGLSFSRLYWTGMPYYDSLNLPKRKIRTTGLGLSFSAHLKLTKNFKAGVLYQPNLLNINRAPAFQYQHLLTFHFTWNFSGRRSSSRR